jgi:hypothetical protein
MKHGDFTGLARDYARFRPGLCSPGRSRPCSAIWGAIRQVDAADVGAGTGIWTRMLAVRGCARSPRWNPTTTCASRVSRPPGTRASLEQGLGGGRPASRTVRSIWSPWPPRSTGPISTGRAPSFTACCGPAGVFVAVWNPRLIEANPLLVEIEAELTRLKPDREDGCPPAARGSPSG